MRSHHTTVHEDPYPAASQGKGLFQTGLICRKQRQQQEQQQKQGGGGGGRDEKDSDQRQEEEMKHSAACTKYCCTYWGEYAT